MYVLYFISCSLCVVASRGFNSKNSMLRIFNCLKGTQKEGIFFHHNKKFNVDCYTYAYFSGLYGAEDTQNPMFFSSQVLDM